MYKLKYIFAKKLEEVKTDKELNESDKIYIETLLVDLFNKVIKEVGKKYLPKTKETGK